MTDTEPTDAPWAAYLVDAEGFVLDEPRALLAIIDDVEAIEQSYGDCIPETITICRNDARPQPQSPGSDFLRQPSSRTINDFIDIPVHDEFPERALLLWTAAQGAKQALNRVAQAEAKS